MDDTGLEQISQHWRSNRSGTGTALKADGRYGAGVRDLTSPWRANRAGLGHRWKRLRRRKALGVRTSALRWKKNRSGIGPASKAARRRKALEIVTSFFRSITTRARILLLPAPRFPAGQRRQFYFWKLNRRWRRTRLLTGGHPRVWGSSPPTSALSPSSSWPRTPASQAGNGEFNSPRGRFAGFARVGGRSPRMGEPVGSTPTPGSSPR